MILTSIFTRKPHLIQIIKFVSIGALNTGIDFLVLNALIAIFGVGDLGQRYAVFKAISFLVAVTNSYIFNKYWVFAGNQRKSKAQEGILFFVVSGIGFLLNVSISTGVFMFVSSAFPLRHYIAANIGAVLGSIFVLAWNFTGYKLIVFKKNE